MLLQMYKDGGCPASPSLAVLPDNAEECQIQQALAGKVMWQEASASARVLGVVRKAWGMHTVDGILILSQQTLQKRCRITWVLLEVHL